MTEVSYEKKREGFTFYWSFFDCVSLFPDNKKREMFQAIIEYALLDKEPEFKSPYFYSLFALIRPNIDSSIRSYDQKKRARAEKAKKKYAICFKEIDEESGETKEIGIDAISGEALGETK